MNANQSKNNHSEWIKSILRLVKVLRITVSSKDLSRISRTLSKLLLWKRREGAAGVKRWKTISDTLVRALVTGNTVIRNGKQYRPRDFSWIWMYKKSIRHKVFVMTVLSWHRLCYCNVQVDLDPIINRGNLKVRTLLHLSRELSTLGLVKVTKTENGRAWLGKHIIMRQSTAGPLDGPNFATFVTQFYMIMNTSLRFWVILWLAAHLATIGYIRRLHWIGFIRDVILHGIANVPFLKREKYIWKAALKLLFKCLDTPLPSRLALLSDRSGKTRVVAIGDIWTQALLKPLHDCMFKVLKRIGSDGTYDQDKQRERIKRWTQNAKEKIFSFDLTAATDRLPVSFQALVLWWSGFLPFWLTPVWMGLLTDRDWLVDFRSNIEVQHASSRVHHKIIRTLNRKLLRQGQKASFYRVKPPSRNTVVGDVRYSVGQPMGLYSSWSSLAWCHHVIVWLAAQRAGRRDPTRFRRYAVLGDDVVIGCPNVAKHYRDIMDSLGVEINLTKSYQMVGVAEFAKSLYVGGNDISPISPSILLLGKEYYHEDTLILLEMLYKRGIRPTLKEFLDILPEKKVYTESVLLVTSPYSPVSFPVGVWGDDFLNPAHTREDLKFYVSFMTFTDRVTNFKKVSRLSRTIHSLRKGCPNFGGFLNPYRNMIHELYHSYRGVMVLELDEIQFTFGMGDNFIFWTSWELEYSYMHVGTEATMPMSDGDICWKGYNPISDTKFTRVSSIAQQRSALKPKKILRLAKILRYESRCRLLCQTFIQGSITSKGSA